MSYEHGRNEHTLVSDGALASLAVIGKFAPGYSPVTVRACSCIFTTGATAAGIVLFKKRPTAGSATGESTVATINFTSGTGAQGNCIYVDGLDVTISPGEELIAEVTDVSATGNATCVASVGQSWETPANNTSMAVSA